MGSGRLLLPGDTSFSQMDVLLIGVRGALVKRTCSGQYPPMQWTVHNAKHGQVFVEEVKAAWRVRSYYEAGNLMIESGRRHQASRLPTLGGWR